MNIRRQVWHSNIVSRLVIALVLTLLVHVAGSGGRGLAAQSQFGLPIVSWENDQRLPVLASSGDGALAVWEDHHWAFGEARDIYARPLSTTGEPRGVVTAVSWEGGAERLAPDVTALADGSYLVVWELAFSEDDHDIYARRVGADGSPIGPEIPIATPSTFESSPRVAYDAAAGVLLVVWERRAGSSRLPNQDVIGQRLAPDGSLLGGPIPIATDDGVLPQGLPDVAAGGGGFLVVWQDGSSGHFDIRGRHVRADGDLSTPRKITGSDRDQLRPRLAADLEAGRLLVAWEDDHRGPGAPPEIRARLVASDGSGLGEAFRVADEDERPMQRPDVAFQPAAGAYLLSWAWEQDPANHDLHARWVAAEGELTGAPRLIATGPSWEGSPAVAPAGDGRAIVAWEDGRQAASNGLDIYAAAVDLPMPPSATPEPSRIASPSATQLPSPSATVTASSTIVASPTATATGTDEPTSVPSATRTELPTATDTLTPIDPTATRTSTASAPTSTVAPSATEPPTSTRTASATPDGQGETALRGFLGHVRLAGADGAPAVPLAGVIVALHGGDAPDDPGEPIARARSGDDGLFYLAHRGRFAELPRYFNLLLSHPGVEVERYSAGPGGEARSERWMQFSSDGEARIEGIEWMLGGLPEPVPPDRIGPVPERSGGPPRSTLPPSKIEPIDFRVDGIELTQAVQCYDTSQGDSACPDNSLKLVDGKLTAARVYISRVAPNVGTGLYPKLRVDLSVSNSGSTTEGSFSAVGLISQRAVMPMASEGDKAHTTINFLIPSPQAGTLTASARINVDRSWPDPNPSNDESPVATAKVVEARAVSLPWLRMRYQPDKSVKYPSRPFAGPALADPAWIQGKSARILRWLYPTPRLNYQPIANPVRDYYFDLPSQGAGRSSTLVRHQPDIRDDFSWHGKSYSVPYVFMTTRLSDLFVSGDSLFAWFPKGSFAGMQTQAAAQGAPPTYPGAGEVALGEAAYDRLLAHEVAHNFGLGHFPCFLNPKGQHNWPAPYDNCSPVENSFDPARMRVEPTMTFMTYGGQSIAPVEWRFLLDRLEKPSKTSSAMQLGQVSDSRPAQAERAGIRVKGLWTTEGQGGFYPLYEVPVGAEAIPGPPDDPDAAYLALLDGAGRVLARYALPDRAPGTALPDEHRATEDLLAVDLRLPKPEDLARIELRRAGETLAAIGRSAAIPTLELRSPSEGQVLSGQVPVRWQASDADGDALYARIEFSADGGSTWRQLAVNVAGDELTLDSDALRGCEDCRLRLQVSDGWHAVVEEVGPLQIGRKAPVVWIEAEGTIDLEPDRMLVLTADAFDLEDPQLPDSAFVWSAAGRGELGRGRNLVLPGGWFEPGRYELRIRVTDSDGQIGEAAQWLRVGWRGFLPLLQR